jgi:hypothetical protein
VQARLLAVEEQVSRCACALSSQERQLRTVAEGAAEQLAASRHDAAQALEAAERAEQQSIALLNQQAAKTQDMLRQVQTLAVTAAFHDVCIMSPLPPGAAAASRCMNRVQCLIARGMWSMIGTGAWSWHRSWVMGGTASSGLQDNADQQKRASDAAAALQHLREAHEALAERVEAVAASKQDASTSVSQEQLAAAVAQVCKEAAFQTRITANIICRW